MAVLTTKRFLLLLALGGAVYAKRRQAAPAPAPAAPRPVSIVPPTPAPPAAPEPVVDLPAAEPPAVAETAVVAEGTYGPGSAAPLDGGASPGPGFTIKGNADSMLFHTTESPYFKRTIAEQWFASEDAARAAGFRRWNDPKPVPEGKYGPGSAHPLSGGASPGADFTVKGNEDSMLFHTEESPYFERTIAEQWFASEEAAKAAGFSRWSD